MYVQNPLSYRICCNVIVPMHNFDSCAFRSFLPLFNLSLLCIW